MQSVMEKVVSTINFIRIRGLNHSQFQQFLVEVDAKYGHVIYFSQVLWLSHASHRAQLPGFGLSLKKLKFL